MGLAKEDEGSMIAAVCTQPIKEWRDRGGAIQRIDSTFTGMEPVSGEFPSMNGVCVDHKGNIYFASSNFNFFNPDGAVYRILKRDDGSYSDPAIFVKNAGLANGLYFDPYQQLIFLSNTIGGVYSFSPGDSTLNEVYLKLRFLEACDDLCTDISGNIWMTDPGYSTVKMFNPGTAVLTRFIIKGIGQTSSCRIRTENGEEILYITELKTRQKPLSEHFDGRGVLIVPARSLIRQLEQVMNL
jgi:sugar lactone lactonase YvrE